MEPHLYGGAVNLAHNDGLAAMPCLNRANAIEHVPLPLAVLRHRRTGRAHGGTGGEPDARQLLEPHALCAHGTQGAGHG